MDSSDPENDEQIHTTNSLCRANEFRICRPIGKPLLCFLLRNIFCNVSHWAAWEHATSDQRLPASLRPRCEVCVSIIRHLPQNIPIIRVSQAHTHKKQMHVLFNFAVTLSTQSPEHIRQIYQSPNHAARRRWRQSEKKTRKNDTPGYVQDIHQREIFT